MEENGSSGINLISDIFIFSLFCHCNWGTSNTFSHRSSWHYAPSRVDNGECWIQHSSVDHFLLHNWRQGGERFFWNVSLPYSGRMGKKIEPASVSVKSSIWFYIESSRVLDYLTFIFHGSFNRFETYQQFPFLILNGGFSYHQSLAVGQIKMNKNLRTRTTTSSSNHSKHNCRTHLKKTRMNHVARDLCGCFFTLLICSIVHFKVYSI